MRNICYIAVLFLYIRQNTYFYELNCYMIELIILIANIEKKILTLGIERYKTSMDNCFKLIQQSNYSNCLMLLLLLNFINFWKQTKRPVVSKFTIITINLKKLKSLFSGLRLTRTENPGNCFGENVSIEMTVTNKLRKLPLQLWNFIFQKW